MIITRADRAWYAKSGLYKDRRLQKAWRNLKMEFLRPFVPLVKWLTKWLGKW